MSDDREPVSASEQATTWPEHWDAWSAGERFAFRRLRTLREKSTEAEKRLTSMLPPDGVALLREWDEQREEMALAAVDLTIDRLRRYLPHLDDLLDFAGPHGDELRNSFW